MKTWAPFMLLGSLPALAGFPQPVQPVQLTYGQRHATVVFESDGSAVVHSKALCDCTTLRHEGARLVAEVDTSRFDADTEKQIEAVTADGKKTMLTMRFSVPPALILSSRALVWKVGKPPRPQELRITIPAGSPVQELVEAGTDGNDFDFTTRKLKPGVEYAVTVTPRSTARRTLNRLVLRCVSRDPRSSQQIIYLQVQK